MRRGISLILKNLEYVVCEAENGEQAAKLLAEMEFDLVITDLFLNGRTGLDIFHEFKDRLPVLIITGFSEAPLAEKTRQAAGSAYLEKPFTPHELKEKLDRLLRRN